MTVQEQLESGLSHHRAGRLVVAEKIYRQILAQQPDHADALHMLGVLSMQAGRLDAAVDLIRRAIRISPCVAEAHSNLGGALQGLGRFDEAIASYREAVRLKPDLADGYRSLGNLLMGIDRFDEAIEAYRQAIRVKPEDAAAYNNLGNALKDKGQLDEAIAAFRQAILLNSDLAQAHNNLGNVLKDKGQFDDAIVSFQQAIRLKPEYAEAYSNLGNACLTRGQLDDAIGAYRQAIRLKPDDAPAYNNLGNALKDLGQIDEAVSAIQHAILLNPDFSQAHSNLGNALLNRGQLDEAIAAYRRAVRLKPASAEILSDLLYAIQFHPDCDAGMIFDEHHSWNNRHAEPLGRSIPPHTNDRDPDRPLRIGYVSPDFGEHCQSFFTIPLFSNHDRQRYETYCYADVRRHDLLSERIRGLIEVWRPIRGIQDAEAARIIREDRIDILVDLTMHMANGRPLVFARKPAPVQVAWLAYPGTTGLLAMDYRLTDPYLDPPGMNDRFYSEKSIRLPDTFWCFDPLVPQPSLSALPAETRGHITFGCLNNFCKVNEQVLRLWALVLKAVDRSRMLILCPEGSSRQTLLSILQRESVDADRVELVARRPRLQYLELYHRIDVGLDTFPYNGHTTSLDSIWMGVPVITLVGKTVVGRAGLSQLTNLGLMDLIARTPERFVEIAVGLAKELPRLAELRRTLRSRMEASPLMDAPRFACNIESAYRQMWRNWCAEFR